MIPQYVPGFVQNKIYQTDDPEQLSLSTVYHVRLVEYDRILQAHSLTPTDKTDTVMQLHSSGRLAIVAIQGQHKDDEVVIELKYASPGNPFVSNYKDNQMDTASGAIFRFNPKSHLLPHKQKLEDFAIVAFQHPTLISQSTTESVEKRHTADDVRKKVYQNQYAASEFFDLIDHPFALKAIKQRTDQILSNRTLYLHTLWKIEGDPEQMNISTEQKRDIYLARSLRECQNLQSADVENLKKLAERLDIDIQQVEHDPILLCNAFVDAWKDLQSSNQ
jgi:hypothetical protein